MQLPISVSSIKSQLSISFKKSGFCNLFPRHLEDNPLILQAQKDNLLEISGQTLVPIIASLFPHYTGILGFHLTSEKKLKLKILSFYLHQVKVIFKHISAGLFSVW